MYKDWGWAGGVRNQRVQMGFGLWVPLGSLNVLGIYWRGLNTSVESTPVGCELWDLMVCVASGYVWYSARRRGYPGRHEAKTLSAVWNNITLCYVSLHYIQFAIFKWLLCLVSYFSKQALHPPSVWQRIFILQFDIPSHLAIICVSPVILLVCRNQEIKPVFPNKYIFDVLKN